MNQNELESALSTYLADTDLNQLGGGVRPTEQLLSGPFNNFFQDDMLTLLSRNTDRLPHKLDQLKRFLEIVADKRKPRHERARAAVEVGRYVRAYHGSTRSSAEGGTSKPQDWFRLATDLNSVVGAWELANEYLAQGMLTVELDTRTQLLPTLRCTKPGEATTELRLDQGALNAWWVGSRIALRHLQCQFKGWEAEAFRAAIACIVNWLALRPHVKPFSSAGKISIAERTASLFWINPLWKRLIAAASETPTTNINYREYLLDQRKAVLLQLSDGNGAELEASTDMCWSHAKDVDRDAVVVIPGIIAPSSEKSEADYLKRYETLRQPVPLTALPSITQLKAIRTNLEAEFPWAVDAITAVMTDLLARRRHGAVRLGMQPLLLAGTPGTGKTRFAQRLSELLGTPNTVINLAGMSDEKTFKGLTRGWSSNRPSRMIEFIQQTGVANPLFILDEVDKAQVRGYGNSGRPHDALLDLLEPGNARRYSDVYLMTECDLSHCLYVLTTNSLLALPEPLQSRVRIVLFRAPEPSHADVIVQGILRDMERAWDIPPGTLTVTPRDMSRLAGLAPRQMKQALLDLFGEQTDEARYTLH
jgi:hypothetical protein